jgi:hypothetical protein
MNDVNILPFPDIFPRYMLCGAYNNFNLQHFFNYLKSHMNFDEPQHLRIVVQDDLSDNVDIYSLDSPLIIE